MPAQPHLTVGEVARLYSVDAWRVRKVVDEIDTEIPRAGRYRLIPRALLGEIAARLRDRGWLPHTPADTNLPATARPGLETNRVESGQGGRSVRTTPKRG